MYFVQSPPVPGRNSTNRIKSPNPPTPNGIPRQQISNVENKQKPHNTMFKSGHQGINDLGIPKVSIEQRLQQQIDENKKLQQENMKLNDVIMQKNIQIGKFIKNFNDDQDETKDQQIDKLEKKIIALTGELEEKNKLINEISDNKDIFDKHNTTNDYYFGNFLIQEVEQKIDLLIQENEGLKKKLSQYQNLKYIQEKNKEYEMILRQISDKCSGVFQ